MYMIQQKLHRAYVFGVIVFCLVFTTAVNAMVPKSEKNVLLELYKSTQGQKWNTTWDVNAPVDTWFGVTVQNGHVVE